MLDIPAILMLNCLGSYFYSIVSYVSHQNSENALLYYLSLGKLTFRSLVTEEVISMYGDNPWGYQPVILEDLEQKDLKIDHSFFKYLFKKHNIHVEILDFSSNANLIGQITSLHAKNSFIICNVDEYFVPTSEKFYFKKHNKHFLLIKKIDHLNQSFEVIDSEKNKTINLKFSEMEQAVYQSFYKRKICYHVNCISYKDIIDRNEMLHNYLSLNSSCEYITQLINDIQDKSFLSDFHYYYSGYYNTLLSKILPHALMKHHILKEHDVIFHDKAHELVLKWRNLCNFMLFKIQKKEISAEPLIKKLRDISKYELRLQSLLNEIQ